MPSVGREAPDPVCSRCSKPIMRGTAAQYAGRPVHMRCIAGATQLDAIEQQDRAHGEREQSRALRDWARGEREQSRALREQAGELVGRARAVQRVCPVCDRPLKDGGSLLFQDDMLVHAICWRLKRGDGQEPEDECSVCGQPLTSAGGRMIDPAGRHCHLSCPPKQP